MIASKSYRKTSASRAAQCGAVMPFVVVSMLVLIAFLGVSVDMMRSVYTVRRLQFALDAAALHAYSYAASDTVAYDTARMQTAIQDPNGSAGGAWNDAPAGGTDRSSPARTDVLVNPSEMVLVENPEDQSERFLQLIGRRQGQDGLRFAFLPALYTMDAMSGGAVPAEAQGMEPARITEVIGQPATRIGAGPPRGGASSQRQADLQGFASFPLAISNQQFLAASLPNEPRVTYTIDLVQSTDPPAAAQPGHIKGAFVNVSGTAAAYGGGQGNVALDQLDRLAKYFWAAADASALAPYVVERGSQIRAFDPADALFQSRRAQLFVTLTQVPVGRHYIIPVLRNDPNFAGPNEVVGFARLRINRIVGVNPGTGSQEFSIIADIGQSVPVRNTASGGGLSTTFPNPNNGALMPAPVNPFADRQWNQAANSISVRNRGVVLSPALSPRKLTPS